MSAALFRPEAHNTLIELRGRAPLRLHEVRCRTRHDNRVELTEFGPKTTLGAGGVATEAGTEQDRRSRFGCVVSESSQELRQGGGNRPECELILAVAEQGH